MGCSVRQAEGRAAIQDHLMGEGHSTDTSDQQTSCEHRIACFKTDGLMAHEFIEARLGHGERDVCMQGDGEAP